MGLLVAAVTFYLRLVTWRHLLAAAGTGLLIGGAVVSLPVSEPELAARLFSGLLAGAGAVFVLPLAAGVPTDDRRGGFEQLVLVRAVPSWSLALGRCVGAIAGGAVLLFSIELAARFVAAQAPMPDEIVGTKMIESADGITSWRFGLPEGTGGPFDLVVETVMLYGGTSELELDVRRGGQEQTVVRKVRQQRRLAVPVPALAASRGDLFVTLRPGRELVLADVSPRLVVGTEALGYGSLGLPMATVRRLLLGLITVVAAACAFRFETACLAGLLALVMPRQDGLVWSISVALLLLVGVLGTALVRRQALP